MMLASLWFYCALSIPSFASAYLENNGKFHKDLIFGTSSSAYQIEGGWNIDGKGLSIWDYYVHKEPSPILNNDTGDIACDSYHKYKEDVRLAAQLGIKLYRFSISWSRILPTGYSNVTNSKGLEYYKNLINEIRAYGMIPAATIYHFDLPLQLYNDGIDWRNVELVDHFVNYARIVITNFPEVGYWFTVNEPKQICLGGYGSGLLAPGIKSDGDLQYQCNYVILKAHAAAYHMYKTEFPQYKENLSVEDPYKLFFYEETLEDMKMVSIRLPEERSNVIESMLKNFPFYTGDYHISLMSAPLYLAKMGIVIDCEWTQAKSNSPTDQAAAERLRQFECGFYFHPVFVGDWPDIVKQRINDRDMKRNLTKRRLPMFTEEEISYIKGTHDFLALNHYSTQLAEDEEAHYNKSSYNADTGVAISFDPKWTVESDGVFAIVPYGVYDILRWIKKEYGNQDILITEIGISDDGSNLNDVQRINLYTDYLCYILEAIKDGVEVIGISFWTLTDNLEWVLGYSAHFGLYHVDFTHPNRTRTPKQSVKFVQNLTSTRKLKCRAPSRHWPGPMRLSNLRDRKHSEH